MDFADHVMGFFCEGYGTSDCIVVENFFKRHRIGSR
jgi:hypothetical protein